MCLPGAMLSPEGIPLSLTPLPSLKQVHIENE